MKVVDLMEHLETGDRSMEHLKAEPPADEGLTFQRLRDAMSDIGSGLFNGLAGSSLGLAQQQMNQFQNINQQFAQQSIQGGAPWNR